jgi:antitoxin component of MazEF toxin-antitoxin module
VTLPVAALALAHLRPGDELQVEVEGEGRLSLTRTHDPLDDFVGSIPGLSAATDLEALRDEWDRSS